MFFGITILAGVSLRSFLKQIQGAELPVADVRQASRTYCTT